MQTQIVIGAIITLGSLLGLRHDRAILEQTGYGRWITWLFGAEKGLWFLRLVIILFALFGVLLASNVIRPIRW
ncbi:MAG: hypothetical protein U0903_09140 [Planctomycetales bacterium]